MIEGLLPPNTTPLQLLYTQNHIPTEQMSGAMYQVPGAGSSATHVGQTGHLPW